MDHFWSVMSVFVEERAGNRRELPKGVFCHNLEFTLRLCYDNKVWVNFTVDRSVCHGANKGEKIDHCVACGAGGQI